MAVRTRPARRRVPALRVALWTVAGAVVAAGVLLISVYVAGILAREFPGAESASWAQAVGTVLAIIVGFGSTIYQVERQRGEREAALSAVGRAAYLLAYDALETVSDRLEAALTRDSKKKSLALRGARTSEMVAAMRGFDTSRLPTDILADFVRLRSRVFAINERISEVYKEEETLSGDARQTARGQRSARLGSAVTVRDEALGFFESLEQVADSSYQAERRTLTEHPRIQAHPRDNTLGTQQ